MAEATLSVTFAGPQVSFQDGGRRGWMRYGVPASGPMDRFAHATANRALGRPAEATAIEVSMGGLALTCDSGTVSFALCGGGFTVDHAGAKVEGWVVRRLTAGETLTIRAGKWGSWATLAFAGVLKSDRWLGAAATHAVSGFGGGLLQAGQRLTIENAGATPAREGALPPPPLPDPTARLPIVPGPQEDQFAPDALATLTGAPFTVKPAYDRMGMRLDGPKLALGDALSIPSEPTLRGSIQVAGDGIATVLLADHQTTGGYPKIATMVSTATDALVQARAGDRLRFVAVTPDEALARARRDIAARQAYLDEVAIPRGTFEDRLMRANLISGVHGEDEI
ncbi:MAG: biotin-dependent carboxyltransferase family protein [Pseudomonadota bacterium]|nr:biotin-dependent carboxyltransferase family protein [Pseudomonadota bacterium]